MSATPRPWTSTGMIVRGADGDFVARCITTRSFRTDTANAALIVRAVNNFDSLLEAARALVANTECPTGDDCGTCPYCEGRAAIAAAEATE